MFLETLKILEYFDFSPLVSDESEAVSVTSRAGSLAYLTNTSNEQ